MGATRGRHEADRPRNVIRESRYARLGLLEIVAADFLDDIGVLFGVAGLISHASRITRRPKNRMSADQTCFKSNNGTNGSKKLTGFDADPVAVVLERTSHLLGDVALKRADVGSYPLFYVSKRRGSIANGDS